MALATSDANFFATAPSTTFVLTPFCSTPGMISLTALSESVTCVERNNEPVVLSNIFSTACRLIVRRSAFEVPN